MKKNSTCPPNRSRQRKAGARPSAIGMDLGDKTSRYCVLDEEGEIVREDSVAQRRRRCCRCSEVGWMPVAIEVGTHSPWVSRLLKSIGLK
jgi:transposase